MLLIIISNEQLWKLLDLFWENTHYLHCTLNIGDCLSGKRMMRQKSCEAEEQIFPSQPFL